MIKKTAYTVAVYKREKRYDCKKGIVSKNVKQFKFLAKFEN